MAAALLQHLWQQAAPGWELVVESAGTGALPGMAASPHAVTAMRDRGLDLTNHLSRTAAGELLTGADLVLTMTERHKERLLANDPALLGRVYSLGEYAGTGEEVPDPFGGSLADYERTAQTLERMLQRVVERISQEGRSEP